LTPYDVYKAPIKVADMKKVKEVLIHDVYFAIEATKHKVFGKSATLS